MGGYLGSVVPHLSAAPFPDIRYKAGVRTFPDLVMVEPGMEGIDVAEAAQAFWTEEWSGPTFMAVGAQNQNFGLNSMLVLRRRIRGCPMPMVIEEAGHFVQKWANGSPLQRSAVSETSRERRTSRSASDVARSVLSLFDGMSTAC